MSRIRILVSNDDGIHARGIALLRQWASDFGEVYVVAPDSQQSASSHALSLHRPLRVHSLDDRSWAVDGSPADCVNLALNGILPERPDFVVAGINHGANLGDDVTYSGTVAVAREARLLGVPSAAFSLDDARMRDAERLEPFIKRIIEFMITRAAEIPAQTFLNVNFPGNREVNGIRFCRQGRRMYGDPIVEKTDPRNRKYYWIGGNILRSEQGEGTDIAAVANGFASVTPISLDATDYRSLEHLSRHSLG